MKLPRFGVEEWLNVHEKSAIYDIAGVSIRPSQWKNYLTCQALIKTPILPNY